MDLGRGALSGIRVLEAGSWIAVPLAGKLLADLGAEVTKLERPAGDPIRRYGPFAPGESNDLNASGLFAHLNSSKRSVLVPDGASVSTLVGTLSDAPDVILVDERFLGSDRAGDIDALQRRLPTAVVVSVTPFGLGGPYGNYASYDITAAASGGISCSVGEPERAPLPLPFSQSEQQAGLCAAIAAALGVLAARRDGHGDHVDLSIQEVLAALHCGYFLPRYLFGGGVVGLRAGRVGGAQPYPNTVLRCRDGLVSVIAPKIDQWRRFLKLMGDPGWAREPRYRNRRAMQWEYKDEVDALVEPWFRERDKNQLVEMFVAHRIPFAPLLTGRDLAESVYLRQRDAIREGLLASGTPALLPTVPYRFSRSEWRSDRAPRLGEHGRIASSASSASASEPENDPPQRADLPRGAPPLTGIRVLDLGTAWAGGIAGRILGDYGADVIKIESWSHMDGSRMGRPIVVDDVSGGDAGDWPDLQPGFHVHGRSKRSLTLDLTCEQGQKIFQNLARQADVVIHNFPPTTARALLVTADELCPANPRLVVVSQSVAGARGPLADYTGYASTVASLGGLAHGIGYSGEIPIGSFEGIYTDVVSAIATVFATIAALVDREASGLGQGVDVSQWEATLALAPIPLLEYSLRGEISGPQGFEHPLLCPHGNYPAKPPIGDEEPPGGTWLSIAVGDSAEWRALLEHIDPNRTLGSDASQWDLQTRRRHSDKIDQAIVDWLATSDVVSAQTELQQAGVAAFRVLTVADSFVDPQLVDRGTYITVEHPKVGYEPMPGLPWNFTRTPCVVTRRAPLLGEHSFEVLAELIGITREDFAGLVADGIVQSKPRTHREM